MAEPEQHEEKHDPQPDGEELERRSEHDEGLQVLEEHAAEAEEERLPTPQPVVPPPGAGAEDGAAVPVEPDLVLALKQLSADFDNYRRRSEAQLREAAKRGQDEFLRELVPVLVDLQAALDQPVGQDVQVLRQGLVLLQEKLLACIRTLGYNRIEAKGQRMDPRRFEALFTVPSSEASPGTVLEELSPGFERDGKVILPAKVSVAKEA